MHLTAERLDRIQPSLTIAIATKARHMIAEGKNVISLSQGEPDFDTPRNVKDAAIRAIEANETHYTDVAGTPALRKAVAEKFKRDSGIDYKPEEIIISTGGKQVIFNAMLATLNAGDEVIIPSPCWVSYPDIVTLGRWQAGAGPLRAEPRLQAARRGPGSRRSPPSTKWFMLNNPCNPTGAAYSKEELRPICDVLMRHPDIWIFTDDIYEKLAYDGFKPATIVEVEPRLQDAHRDDERLLQGLCDDRLAHRLRRRTVGADQGDGQAAEPVHLEHQLDRPGGGCRGADRPAGIDRGNAQGLRGTPRPRGRDAEQGARPLLPQARGRVLRLSLDPRLHRQDQRAAASRSPTTKASSLALLEEDGVAAVHGAAFCYPGHFRISYANATAKSCAKPARASSSFCEGLH